MKETPINYTLNRTHFGCFSECHNYQERKQKIIDTANTGWFCPKNQPYVPFGELANIYKGCKIVAKKLKKFYIESELPEKQKNCRFLIGQERLLDFVEEEKKKESVNKSMDYMQIYKKSNKNEPEINVSSHKKAKKKEENQSLERISMVYKWLGKRKSESLPDDGIEVLKHELADSFIRVNEIKKGKPLTEIVKTQNVNFFIDDKPDYNEKFSQNNTKWPGFNFLNSKNRQNSTKSKILRPQTTQGSPKSKKREEFSLSQIQKNSLIYRNHNIPQKKNELRNSYNPTAQITPSHHSHEISLQNGRNIKPYITLVSLRELIEKVNNLAKNKSILVDMTKGNFDPLKLCEVIDIEFEKFLKEREKRLKKNTRRGAIPVTVVGKRQTVVNRTALKLSVVSELKKSPKHRFTFKNVSAFDEIKIPHKTAEKPQENNNIKINTSLNLPKKDIEKNQCDESNHEKLFKIFNKPPEIDSSIAIKTAFENFDKTRLDLRQKLVNSLDAQNNNRPRTFHYKSHSITVSGIHSKFEHEILKMRTKAEKLKTQDYIEFAKTHAKIYYSLAKKLLQESANLHSDIHFIMDYYKSVIESGNYLDNGNIKYLMENIFPTPVTSEITYILYEITKGMGWNIEEFKNCCQKYNISIENIQF